MPRINNRMHIKSLLYIILFGCPAFFSFQNNPADDFFNSLIKGKQDITNYVDKDELLRSSRLGISYEGVTNKFLISYDIDSAVKKDITDKHLEYQTHEIEKDGEYSIVDFSVPVLAYSKDFYFKSDKFISPAAYYSRNWKEITSKYFIFRISDINYFNDYCINRLDSFVDDMADKLGFSDADKQLLQKEKIYYILCKDADEIKKVSGFDMRGQYLPAFDEILTTYNTHFHELCHFLINFKLRHLSLYTLPFFLEGFAVAEGGRGGLSANVVTGTGLFLQGEGILDYESIVTNNDFYNEDASLTYPVAGLYDQFLISKIGMKEYLELYKKVNGGLEFIKNIGRKDIELPDKSLFEQFLDSYKLETPLYLKNISTLSKAEDMDINGKVVDADSIYVFFARNNFIGLIQKNETREKGYTSRLFESMTKKKYNGEIYLVNVDSGFVKIYNCLNDELIFSYDVNLSLNGEPVPYYIQSNKSNNENPEQRVFYFGIKKSAFDMDFKN